MVKITANKNGNYKVDGPVTIEDAAGKVTEVPAGQSVFLCRCGGSKNKPFCDGSHKANGFTADK